MAPTLKPPNRLEVIGFPTFATSWYGDPADGTSIVAYSGGGGSARTGVNNSVAVTVGDAAEPKVISTDSRVGIALHIYCNPLTKKLWMLVSLESVVQRYSLPDCQLNGTLKVLGGGCGCFAVNAMADRLALGCENGTILVHTLSDDTFGQGPDVVAKPLYICSDKHTKAVCAVTFSMRGDRFLSCGKDGITCVWAQEDGSFLTSVECTVDIAKAAAPKKPSNRPVQIMVRGCAFGDLEGNVFYTVASARRGKAFLARWIKNKADDSYICNDRVACSEYPVSAMSLSQDGGLLVLGGTDGNVTLWSTSEWKPLKIFKEVHGLPVTCAAPRPYPVRLQGEEDGVEIHARTASADGSLACLTLQRPQRSSSGGEWSILVLMHRFFVLLLVLWLLSPVLKEAADKCQPFTGDIGAVRRCIVEDVLIAPAWRPGITVPPY